LAHDERGDLGRLLRAFADAGRGLAAAVSGQIAFRVEIVVALVALPAALWLGESPAERGLLIVSAGLVPLVELVNTAIETTVDRVGKAYHPLAGRAKDLGAAALLFALVLAGLVWSAVVFT